MDLVNATPLPAKIVVDRDEAGRSIGLIAKATFIVENGRALLDSEKPYGVFGADVDTELGVLPADERPVRDDCVEVCLTGAAYPPGDLPAATSRVLLRVGDHRNELLVFGDRR